jgi:signal transduction histidine kinase
LAAVSHELRSPLNAILGFADILLQEVDGPLAPSSREEVEQIKGSGQHLLELINDILEFSAIESGQLKLSLSPVDVQQVARDVARELAVVIGKKPVRLDLVDGAPVYALVDARRVRQILGNLIGNAIKFTQAGEVGVRVSVDERGAVISVRDTGPGISEREQRIIFEEYKQAREEKGKKRGTGLGLAITRRLVLLHRGSIELSSAVGRGSTFVVHLPLANIDDLPTRRLN